jgi:hypothetical protein
MLANNRPTPHQIEDLARLPAGLAPLMEQQRWLNWSYVWDDKRGEWTKEPRGNGGSLKWGCPHHWMTHAEAVAAMRAGGHDGIGFVLSADCEAAGIDVDKCLREQNGEWVVSAWAEPIVDAARGAGCYVEVTVGGRGFRVIGTTKRQVSIVCNIKGEEQADGSLKIISKPPKGSPGFEIYCRPKNQYITVSGIEVGEGSALAPIDEVIDLLQQLYPQRAKPAAVISEFFDLVADIDLVAPFSRRAVREPADLRGHITRECAR